MPPDPATPQADCALSITEVGLLTVAERRGLIRTPAKIDPSADPANVERFAVLRRLVERGLAEQAAPEPDEAGELVFRVTERGRAALRVCDDFRLPPE